MVATAGAASPRVKLAGILLAGSAVAVGLGVYGRVHHPASRPLFLLGFSGMLQLKTWLATIALALAVVQVCTASWMWQRLPGAGPPPNWVGPVHRWTGSLAFVALVPVALHCLWSLGFVSYSSRALAHGIAGCAFYGAYTAKMLGLRVRGLPGWTLPVLGGVLFALLVVTWLTSALWFFSRSGLPLT
jgi:Family of unknown function (DUF6529)